LSKIRECLSRRSNTRWQKDQQGSNVGISRRCAERPGSGLAAGSERGVARPTLLADVRCRNT
jgi:hypothetical protein